MEEKDRFAFLADWYDPTAALLRRYQLFYYPHDSSVEMFDVKNQRIFLRRTKYGDLRPGDLFVGGRVNVFSRQLNIVDYGDKYTATKLGSKKERTLALLKPDGVNKVGDVLEMANQANLMVTNAKMTHLTWSQAADFYVEHQSKPFFNSLVQQVCSGPVVALELVGDEAVSVWRNLLGHSDAAAAAAAAAAAHKEAPQSARGQLGSDLAHGSDSLSAAARELEFFFPTTICHGPVNTALYSQCTCCIIKPHAVSQGLAGKIVNSIAAGGFHISALQMFNVDRANAEEFYEVYKGVVTEYADMVTELSLGPSMVLELHGADVAKTFRDFCGPADPDIARHLRPSTLRAIYGSDKVKNAVHCTDLAEDAILEVQYFFKILDG
ncbi:nucleoside diphosphate kinase 7 isoform X1 [Phyllopteryx taeniolatus]|uniref:nucleoside diphosphate kinase 7 isoform X1 n=1 Tax=Phyllopteryx taeniolatus TaxID=161469 RepID=UPI002AD4A3DB|nr:nucleoside diphosphate kinase 7 isoform X1 [Phyllopteryx taeniolatus]